MRSSRRHVALLGLTAAGKTTVGNAVAGELGRPFLDSDELLAIRHGRTGGEIAARDGVGRLHRLEAELTVSMLGEEEPAVIAVPASALDDAAARRALTRDALCIWLDADTDVLAARQRSPGHRRPLDADDLRRLRRSRAPHLEQLADASFDTGAVAVETVVAAIVTMVSGST